MRTFVTCLVRMTTVSTASHAMTTRVTFLAISFISLLHFCRQNIRVVRGLVVSGVIYETSLLFITLIEKYRYRSNLNIPTYYSNAK